MESLNNLLVSGDGDLLLFGFEVFMQSPGKSLFVLGILFSTAAAARADEFGCTVLLCLSNPAGWTTVSECRAPIQKMLQILRGRGSFVCDTGASGVGGVVVSQGRKAADRWIQWTDAAGTARRENF